MTVHERAYNLIDQFSEDDIPKDTSSDLISPKMKAFMRMEQLRKITAQYDISEAQRAKAMDEKYG